MNSLGKFITFEGGEGSGKSTQIKLLSQFLKQQNIKHIITREPGGTNIGDQIRKILVTSSNNQDDIMQPLTELLLHSASRTQHIAEKINPALASGVWVLCDRFVDSTIAYQAYAHSLGINYVNMLINLTIGNLRPNLTLIFDLDVKIGLARTVIRNNDENRYEQMDIKFHNTLRQAFLELANQNYNRYKIVDATQTIDAIQAEVQQLISQNLL